MSKDEEGRVFLRGIASATYGLGEFRRRQRSATRVVKQGTVVDDATVAHSGDSEQSRTWWMLGPGDEPFRSQTLQVHFVELLPGGSNHGHGHQNEACFYILEGKGYEIHDERRYEWEADDFVFVHTDSVHRHFNASKTERALAIVIKAKCAWMYLGMWQQGRAAPFTDDATYGPREDWSRLWTPGSAELKKVVKKSDTKWETTRDGRVRVLNAPDRSENRNHSVDAYQQEIAPGARSAKHWHMADEVCYVMGGTGHSLHWDVEAEIAEKYHARVAKTPSRHEFAKGDLVYIPQNTVHQHVNTGTEPVLLLSAQNRLFKTLGYDSVVYLEDASAQAKPEVASARR